MKIAIVSTLHNPISSAFAGGIEVFNFNLLKGLTQKGHDVTLFASGDSKVEGKLYPACPAALFSDKFEFKPNDSQSMRKAIYYENHYYIKTMEYIEKNGFNIIHQSHTSFLPMYLAYKFKIPQLLTVHMTANTNMTLNTDLKEIMPAGAIPLISISKKQEQILSDLTFYEKVYHGIDLDNFKYNDKSSDYVAWLGRIAPNKGTKEVIKVVIGANKKMKLAGQIGVGKVVSDYFEQLKPLMKNPLIEYLGPADNNLRNDLLQNAKVLLFPIDWEEPFGLVMIEAMACGTPVIAFRRGSVPEIIKDGKTGFICPPNDIEAMTEAVKKIYEMPDDEYRLMRQNCRKHVEENFTIEKMVEQYENIYDKILLLARGTTIELY